MRCGWVSSRFSGDWIINGSMVVLDIVLYDRKFDIQWLKMSSYQGDYFFCILTLLLLLESEFSEFKNEQNLKPFTR
jgi:hypothetical protein